MGAALARLIWTGEWCAGDLDAAPVLGTIEGAPAKDPSQLRIFDLASLTKVIATSTLLAEFAVETFRKDSSWNWSRFLNEPLVYKIPELTGTPLEMISLIEVWEHRSGVPAHGLVFDPPRAFDVRRKRDIVWKRALQKITSLSIACPGAEIYSDLGFLLLGVYLERSTQHSIDELWDCWKNRHSLLSDTFAFGVKPELLARVMPTEERHRAGQVNDDNCFSMGGVSPHAGLFGTAQDVWSWLVALRKWAAEEACVAEWLTGSEHKHRFCLGWDTPSQGEGASTSQAGAGAPPDTLGHLGYTGTSVWWSPQSHRAGVLLTNRVYPAHSAQSQAQIRSLRQEFYTSLWHNESWGVSQWNRFLAKVANTARP